MQTGTKRAAPKGHAKASVASNKASASKSSLLPTPATNAKGQIYCPLKQEYHDPLPEERVRQTYILHLNQHYGYAFDQMAQELRVQHGRRSPRTDIVVWESAQARVSGKTPVLVVECKAESVDIHPRDYYQGESYTRAVGCEILITHNERQTAIFKLVPGTPGEAIQINDLPSANDWGNAKRIEEIKNSTRAFSRKEFQDLLFKCHSILRDVHKMEPGRAFDAISKVLFIKMYVERTGTWGTFTTDYLDKRAAVRLPTDPPVHEQLFEQTRKHYKDDEIFSEKDELDISEETFRRIVRELERFNLSVTGDDVKGLAFEQFLGTTFRGELGQFFTPRPIVDFMVDLLDPQEKELICDPASGSGGFLIRAFEHVRNKIQADVQEQKDHARAEVEARGLPEEEEISLIEQTFTTLNRELDPDQDNPPSRLRKLAHEFIFGTDAEPRAARTSKMNMIMHGDGHGGIHYHDGFVDINGVFPERFDVVLTNPPFGQDVGEDQKFGTSEQTRVADDPAYRRRCRERYGKSWEQAHGRAVAAAKSHQKILDAYQIGRDKPNRPTEILFTERCLQLLKPGGRMGIVLPDGNLNNPSLGWLRRWAEGKARIMMIVSLPEETFVSSETTVKASLVFLRRFTAEDEAKWEECWQTAHQKHDGQFDDQRTKLCAEFGPRIKCGDSVDVANLLKKLDAAGVYREMPNWRKATPPPYPRGIVVTTVGKPRWTGEVKDKKQAQKLRQQLKKKWSDDIEKCAEQFHRQLRAALRKVDAEHFAALWQEVRMLFDYPVPTAAPELVGITSTGAEGPNQLPLILAGYRKVEAWMKAGAADVDIPELGI